MRIISFGELYIDYYFNNNIVLGLCGGRCNANIIANLSKHFETKYIGKVGNDIQGRIAVDSLAKLGVDVTDIKVSEKITNKLFINPKGYSNKCPYCAREAKHIEYELDYKEILNRINKDDLIVLDQIDELSLNIINNINNKVFLDLKYLGDILYLPLDEIEELLNNRFEIINMNEKVYHLLRDKFAIDSYDIYELLKPKVLIINRGKKGVDIIYDEVIDNKETEEEIKEVDLSGASDAFFAEFIKTMIDKNLLYNSKNISLAYMKANSMFNYVSKNYGARTHLEPLYKIDNSHECICKNIEVTIK